MKGDDQDRWGLKSLSDTGITIMCTKITWEARVLKNPIGGPVLSLDAQTSKLIDLAN